jgi:hypothetical protein
MGGLAQALRLLLEINRKGLTKNPALGLVRVPRQGSDLRNTTEADT